MPEKKKKQQEDLPQEELQENQEAAQAAPEEPAPQQEEAPDELAQAKQQLEQQLAEANDRLLRTLAEYDNYRKRTQKEKDSIYPQAQADTVARFLPVLDNFERAMQSECTDPSFKKGMEMIFDSLVHTLGELKVEEIGKEGETFDASLHNAVMHVEDEAYGENVIVQVLQKGYRLGDRVIRYAMVKVAN